MTTAVYETPGSGETSQYGAFELKQYINKSTVRSFIITIALMLLLFLLWFAVQQLTAEDESKRIVAPRVKIDLSQLPPPPQAADMPPPPPTPKVVDVASGPAARAGNPVPVPDEMIAPDVKEFASTDQISRATTEGGEGEDFGGTFETQGNGNTQVDIGIREEEPSPDDFISVEVQPGIDLAQIQKLAVYPDMAKRANIEGKVTVQVLIDKTGKPVKTQIMQSANTMLNEAAIKAVMSATYTPARQNKQPVAVWAAIPVTFKLR
ncbi:MAG: energy transducer TonB [Bacteroidota bacterium]